jgi:pimeloyl-ACP methyl ester carboxylesterase
MPGTEDRTVQLADVSLHYRETGAPDGLPVIALHGHPGEGAASWDETAPLVCAAGPYRFLGLTQRGYGASGRRGPYSFESFSDDVFAFASALGSARFVPLGHSMGGTIASLAAEREPDRLLGLVLEDSVLPREGGRRAQRAPGRTAALRRSTDRLPRGPGR